MPAYSFQPMFVEPIRAGTKGGTIRAPRKAANRGLHSTARQAIGGHAYPAEELALYCRQRHPSGFLIARKICVAVEPIGLDFLRPRVLLLSSEKVLTEMPALDSFARFDGFKYFEQMAEFWETRHKTDVFDGWHVRWLPLPEMLG